MHCYDQVSNWIRPAKRPRPPFPRPASSSMSCSSSISRPNYRSERSLIKYMNDPSYSERRLLLFAHFSFLKARGSHFKCSKITNLKEIVIFMLLKILPNYRTTKQTFKEHSHSQNSSAGFTSQCCSVLLLPKWALLTISFSAYLTW